MKLTITLPNEFEATDIRQLLEEQWLIPRKVRHFLRTRKNVAINGETAMFHHTVSPGDVLTLTFEETNYPTPQPIVLEDSPINVLWEDDQLIVVNKPAGIKTHHNQPEETGTLINFVAAYLAPKGEFPYVVHRLDKETSGAILFAKNPIVLPVLGRMLEYKEIRRVYEAEVDSKKVPDQLTMTKPIGRDRHDRRKRVIDEQRGQAAVTHMTKMKETSDSTWVECRLDTGRTHQIRVHLTSMGWPILGDPLYHPRAYKRPRLQLHAKELAFTHPFTFEDICVEAKPLLSE